MILNYYHIPFLFGHLVKAIENTDTSSVCCSVDIYADTVLHGLQEVNLITMVFSTSCSGTRFTNSLSSSLTWASAMLSIILFLTPFSAAAQQFLPFLEYHHRGITSIADKLSLGRQFWSHLKSVCVQHRAGPSLFSWKQPLQLHLLPKSCHMNPMQGESFELQILCSAKGRSLFCPVLDIFKHLKLCFPYLISAAAIRNVCALSML